jgi:hypothetical protein
VSGPCAQLEWLPYVPVALLLKAFLLASGLGGALLLAAFHHQVPAVRWLPGPPALGAEARDIRLTGSEGGRAGPWHVEMDLSEQAVWDDHAALVLAWHQPYDFDRAPYLVLHLENAGDRELFCEPHLCDANGFALASQQWLDRPRLRLPAGSRRRWAIRAEVPPGAAEPRQVRLVFRSPPGKHTVILHGVGFTRVNAPDSPEAPLPEPAEAPVEEGRRTVRLRTDTSWQELPTGQQRLLEELERRHVAFFIHHRDPVPGLVPDCAPVRKDRLARPVNRVVSVGGMGFALACWVLAERRGWVASGTAAAWGEQAIRYLLEKTPRRKGVLPHLVDLATGAAASDTEYSTMDMSLLLAGGLVLERHAPGTPAAALVRRLRTGVAWSDLVAPAGDMRALSMGLDRDGALLANSWRDYDESLLLYVLAGGSEAAPVPGEVFQGLARRFPPTRLGAGELAGKSLPLFVHTYPACFLGVQRGARLPGGCEPFAAAVRAVYWNRAFCRGEPEETFRRRFWGVSACYTPAGGYRPLAPVSGMARGVCCPGAVLAAAPFALSTVAQDVEDWGYTDVWPRLLGDFGLCDAFALNGGQVWVHEDAVAITAGAAALGLAEARDACVSELFREAPDVRRGLEACGFQK